MENVLIKNQILRINAKSNLRKPVVSTFSAWDVLMN